MAYDTYFLRKLVRTLLGALVVATMILSCGCSSRGEGITLDGAKQGNAIPVRENFPNGEKGRIRRGAREGLALETGWPFPYQSIT